MINFKNIILAGLVTLSLSGCSKWLDVKPADRIVEEQVFNSESGFYSALNGVYLDMLNGSMYGASLGSEFIDILAQEYNIRATNVDYTSVVNHRYTDIYVKTKLQNTWEASYKLILNSNKILENADKYSDVLPANSKSIIKGEAMAIRAFLHFDLFRLFGPIYTTNSGSPSIPYLDKIKVSANEILPANQFLEKVLNDLSTAEQLLSQSDPIIKNGPMSSAVEGEDNEGRYRTLRLNYYAVLALKARVYLYAKDKVNALKYAKMVIDAPNRATYFPFITYTQILGNSKDPDRIFSTEILFGLLNTGRNSLYTAYFNPDATVSNLLIPRPGTISSLFANEESDYRYYPLWSNSPLEPGAVYSTKYKVGETLTLLRNNMIPLIRLSEVYLIAAESEVNEQESYKYLNVLRNNRGLTNVSNDLTNRLKNEYMKEFFAEGQLFFYYKRNNTTQIKSGVTGNNLAMTVARYVPGLPDSEIKYRD